MSLDQDFNAAVLPHLDAAFNLARWLVRDAAAAEDMVQESFLRALKYFASFKGGDARPWLLGIVRNACFTWLAQRNGQPWFLELDGEEGEPGTIELATGADADPCARLDNKRARLLIDQAIRALPPHLREVIVLRDIEGLPYEDIARIASIPAGTVMSRLSRARAQLRIRLAGLRTEQER